MRCSPAKSKLEAAASRIIPDERVDLVVREGILFKASALQEVHGHSMQDSVSVIIPTLNAERYVAETLESVCEQTFRAAEILVVDDDSSDGTAQLAQSFGPLVRVIRRQKSGKSINRNLGVELATSKWIAFLDADDIWHPRKLELQLKALRERPGAQVCYTARLHFTLERDLRLAGVLIPVPPPERLREALYRNTVFMPSSVLISRSTFLATGGFDPLTLKVEDWEYWLRLLHAGVQFAACEDPLLLYRVHSGSSSKDALASLASAERIFCKHVLPHLPTGQGLLRLNRVLSEHEAQASLTLRRVGDARAAGVMLHSIARDPFHYPRRFVILTHMLLTRFFGVAPRELLGRRKMIWQLLDE